MTALQVPLTKSQKIRKQKLETLERFVKNCLREAPGILLKSEVYEIYILYCNGRKLPKEAIFDKKNFSMELPMHIKVEESNTTRNGKNYRTWRGIRFITQARNLKKLL